ncbi:MAG: 3-phosphoshikimate 1-carboxyvinyltransferase [Pseudomonadota bacterium]
MNALKLGPLRHADGEVWLPGSKSLSNRALLLAALSSGTTTITNLLRSDDVRHMLNALASLGVSYVLSEDDTVCSITGLAGPFAATSPVDLFLGNAGTAMRPLCAALTLGEGDFILHGEPRMHERPIADLVSALQSCGAAIEYLGETGYPPLKIRGTGLRGGRIEVNGQVSSQFLSSLLMCAPYAESDVQIDVIGDLASKPYIDLTIDIMSSFGVSVEQNDYRNFHIRSGQGYTAPGDYMVEGDASSASYFLAAGAIAGGRVKVHGVGAASVQGDIRFAEVLAAMGAKAERGPTWIEASKGELHAVDMDMNHIPDAAMTIATTALFASGSTRIRNIYNWRVKETDRLTAMATELKKLGADVDVGHDYLKVTPPKAIKAAAIDTYDDHRIAMCFSLAAFGGQPVTINDPGCTSKTFPEFFKLFASIAE